jgi:hypothetical protein
MYIPLVFVKSGLMRSGSNYTSYSEIQVKEDQVAPVACVAANSNRRYLRREEGAT